MVNVCATWKEMKRLVCSIDVYAIW